ncbi:MAG: hypothetical protein HXX19_12200 [Rhodoferax sp.]|nr:hypothetical protein [Rhodoferax sp.]
MSATNPLKLPNALGATNAEVTALKGATSYQAVLRTHAVFAAEGVKVHILARVAGGNLRRPQAVLLDASKPVFGTAD